MRNRQPTYTYLLDWHDKKKNSNNSDCYIIAVIIERALKKSIQTLNHTTLNLNENLQPSNGSMVKGFSVFKIKMNEENEDRLALMRKSFRSDFFIILLIIDGSVSFKINFEEVKGVAGDLIIGDLTSIKQVVWFSEDFNVVGLDFTADFIKQINFSALEKILSTMDLFSQKHKNPWPLSTEDRATFLRLLSSLEDRLAKVDKHSFGLELLANGFTDLLYELAETGKKFVDMNSLKIGRKEELTRNFFHLAIKNHINQRQLSFYSDKLFVTTKYLSETVKEITQQTAGEVLDSLNLMEAKRLLEETQLDIRAIAIQMKFGSPAFFSKFFKRLSGLSPSEYRYRLEKQHL